MGGGQGRLRRGPCVLRGRAGGGGRAAGRSAAEARRRPAGHRRPGGVHVVRHGPHAELRGGRLRVRRRPRGQHRLGVPLHLLPGGGLGGAHHHDAHGGGGAGAHRHVQGARLRALAHRLEVPGVRGAGQRGGQRRGHRRAVAGAARRHPEGLRHHLLRAARAAAHRPRAGGACGRLGRGRHAGGHVGRRHGDAARKPGAAHAPARPEGGQAHPAGARPAALAAAVVLLEGHVPQPVPLQEALRHDHGGHRGLHGAAADGPGAFRRHQRHHRQAVRGDNEIQRHHRDRRGPGRRRRGAARRGTRQDGLRF